MSNTSIVIFGGYGQVGRSLAPLLLEYTDANIVIAGRRLEQAEALANHLNKGEADQRVKASYADATKPESLTKAFEGADLIVVTAAVPDYMANIAQACIDVDCDCFDILDPADVVDTLNTLGPEIEKANRLFVTQGGLAPGMVAALVRLAAPSFDHFREARLGLSLSFKTMERPEQVYDVFEHLINNQPAAFEDGQWREKSLNKDKLTMYFGPRFGNRKAFPLDMMELHGLPEKFGLERMSIYGATANWIVDYLLRFSVSLLYKVKPRLGWRTLARFMLWASKKMPREPLGFCTTLEAWGRKDGKDHSLRMIMDNEDNYWGTAATVVAFVFQYFDGVFDGITGVKLMGHLIDPERSVKDLNRIGLKTWIE